MKRLTRRLAKGFTLIELMIVVAIVGILAVLAIYGVRKYLANAKTAEARNSLGQMAKDQAAEYEKENMQNTILGTGTTANLSRALCGGPDGPVPAVGLIKGRKYQSGVGDWNKLMSTNGGFACLKFMMDAPQYYSYNFNSSGTNGNAGDSFNCLANGDLNGDGVLSTFQVTGSINSQMALNIAPNMLEVNPEE